MKRQELPKDDTSFQDVENAIEDETRDENQEFWDTKR